MEIKKIEMSDLVKTKFKDKHCIGFEYTLNNESEEYLFKFEKIIDLNGWRMFAIIPDVASEDKQRMIQFSFGMPVEGMSLVKVASIGLQLFRGILQREITFCSSLDFIIKESLEGE